MAVVVVWGGARRLPSVVSLPFPVSRGLLMLAGVSLSFRLAVVRLKNMLKHPVTVSKHESHLEMAKDTKRHVETRQKLSECTPKKRKMRPKNTKNAKTGFRTHSNSAKCIKPTSEIQKTPNDTLKHAKNLQNPVKEGRGSRQSTLEKAD